MFLEDQVEIHSLENCGGVRIFILNCTPEALRVKLRCALQALLNHDGYSQAELVELIHIGNEKGDMSGTQIYLSNIDLLRFEILPAVICK